MAEKTTNLELVTIRFSGDSGDGMQLTGNQFTNNAAVFGNDISTLPDFPAEIRAPAGSLAGVSSFQLQFSSNEIYTPGDKLDVLVAMNPAGLKVNLKDLKDNGILIINSDNFTKKNLNLAGWESNPIEDSKISEDYRLINVGMTTLVMDSLKDSALSPKQKSRSTNMFALGLLYWLYGRSMDSTMSFIKNKFKSKPDIVDANLKTLKAGFYFGETIEAIRTTYRVPKAKFDQGVYRNILGNHATSLGLLAASENASLELFFGGYPITPASDLLHYLSNYKSFGVKTFQAEDEIAGISAALGASFVGKLSVTASSGPGIALKGEAIGLAIMTELPIVIINVQRGGPSTGLPTKTEQADLFQALYGRNSEAPCVVIAAQSPGDCFYAAYEASRIALEHMIPVMLLTDGYIANGSEPFKIPNVSELPKITPNWYNGDSDSFNPYSRDSKTLARKWVVPGMKGLEHRIGGLEKENITGNVSYDPENHDLMVRLRQEKVEIISKTIPKIKPYGSKKGELLILGWGGTFGAIRSATRKALDEKLSVAHLHLKYLNPLNDELSEILSNYEKVLIPEINLGQLNFIIRSKFLIDTISLNKVSGQPYTSSEILDKIKEILN